MNYWLVALTVTIGSLIGGLYANITPEPAALVTFALLNALSVVLAIFEGKVLLSVFFGSSNRPRLRP